MTTGQDKQLLGALWPSNIRILMLGAERNEFLFYLYRDAYLRK